MVALCTVAEAAFMGQLLAGASLLAAFESDPLAAPTAPFDFQLWLPQAVQSGLLLDVCPVSICFKSANRPHFPCHN